MADANITWDLAKTILTSLLHDLSNSEDVGAQQRADALELRQFLLAGRHQ